MRTSTGHFGDQYWFVFYPQREIFFERGRMFLCVGDKSLCMMGYRSLYCRVDSPSLRGTVRVFLRGVIWSFQKELYLCTNRKDVRRG